LAAKNRGSSRVVFVLLLAIVVAAGFYWRRSRPASPIPETASVPTQPPLPAPPVQTLPPLPAAATQATIPGPEPAWEAAGTTLVDGKPMPLEKRGNERLVRREDGSPLEQYSEIDGVREGLSTRWYPSGNVQSIGEWHAGSRHGSWTEFQEDGGVTQRGSYAQGRREGAWESLYPNGTLRWSGMYHNDRQVGDWMFVTPEGLVDVVHNGPLEGVQQGGK